MFNAPRPGSIRFGTSLNGGLGSFTDNPLATSVYSNDDGLDPWSTAPTPPPPQISNAFGNVIADAQAPSIYNEALAAAEPGISGDISLSSLQRILGTTSIPAATAQKIVNLVSTRPRLSKLEFFVALALVAFAQQDQDVSIEHLASEAQRTNTLPTPILDLSQLPPPTQSQLNGRSPSDPSADVNAPPIPAYSESDPWNISAPTNIRTGVTAGVSAGPLTGGSTFTGGLPPDWWKKQEKVDVTVLPEKQGFILNRYYVFLLQSERGPPVQRRYSEFLFLWDCLVRRYPFRIIPNLPPKRIGPDEIFIEQRRRGLSRFMNFIVNHPVIASDGLLSVFLSEPSFDGWKKHALATVGISYEEESVSHRIDRTEEMSIPRDLEEKMNLVKSRVGMLIEQWSRICLIAERLIKRRESSAADLSRISLTLNTIVEENGKCWHIASDGDCDLHVGVKHGLIASSRRVGNQSELLFSRAHATLLTSLEEFKSHRDLYIAVRDLFVRHARLSTDKVDVLKKRVEFNGRKLEDIKAAKKEGWEQEADKVMGAIERDQIDIASLMARRVFIRYSMWHELRVVLHNRENTLLTQAIQNFAKQEADFAQLVVQNWSGLYEEVESMPFE
ncbi:Sorting nexin mvp1 [Tulasnella sp. 418]|nr:Sorting nexin mvp1 [Tulasnella sp. 418]